jgi:hypothetical protein
MIPAFTVLHYRFAGPDFGQKNAPILDNPLLWTSDA